MRSPSAFHLLIFVGLIGLAFAGTKGVLELDDLTFDKIVGGNRPVLVAFTEFAWKDPEDYSKVVKEFETSDLLVAKVDGSQNEELKKRFGVSSYPTIKLFSSGDKANPASYIGKDSAVSVIDFVRAQLSPELAALKALAAKFVAEPNKRTELLKEAESKIASLSTENKEYGSFYVNSMKKITEKGDDFVSKEKERLQNLVDNKSTTEKKKSEFTKRINILNSFVLSGEASA